MAKKNFTKSIPWTILFFITIYPNMGFLEKSAENVFDSIESVIVNFYNFATGGIDFLAKDATTAIEEELDDMTPNDRDVYDFIIVGAGSAGAVVASRLSEESKVKVLLIEAGIEENAIMDIPLMALYLQLTETINWNYKMERSTAYCRGMQNNQCNMPRGKVMGGCSVLNLMIATRGNHRDYDNWDRMGCDGWSWVDVFPLFLKMENFERQDSVVEPDYHSTGGLLNIAQPPYRTKAATAFLEAGLERNFPVIDYDGKRQIGYSYTHATIKNGSRCSSNRAYLYPAKQRPNLFLTRESHADKVLIDRMSKRAYGVLLTKNGKRIRVIAKKEVIVCAGAIGSPKLLMLSGIGPADHLRELKIRVLKNAPVGENLMDHVIYWGLNFLVNETVTVVTNDIFKPTSPIISEYLTNRTGPLTITGGIEAASFFNVDNMDDREGVPNMELMFTGISMASDPLIHQAISIADEHYNATLANLLNKQSYMIVPTLLTPKSRGRVQLRSKNPKEKPKIYPNYFSQPDDMRIMILGIRESIRLSETQALQRYGSRLPDNPILGCEQFQRDSDPYWDCAARTFCDTLYHPAGTCKMGARNDSTAVVDPRLKVIGIKGLRVADASIMPVIISGHTNVPTIMIGEKLAHMVKEDWRFVQKPKK